MYDLTALLGFLDGHGCSYDIEYHHPVTTVDEALQAGGSLAGAKCKNLLLKDGGGAFLLVLTPYDARIDLRTLAARSGTKRLSFATADELQQRLGVPRGAVSPLALINDADRMVRFIVDERLREADRLLVHPLTNAATLSITLPTFRTFMMAIGRDVEFVNAV